MQAVRAIDTGRCIIFEYKIDLFPTGQTWQVGPVTLDLTSSGDKSVQTLSASDIGPTSPRLRGVCVRLQSRHRRLLA